MWIYRNIVDNLIAGTTKMRPAMEMSAGQRLNTHFSVSAFFLVVSWLVFLSLSPFEPALYANVYRLHGARTYNDKISYEKHRRD